MTSEKPRRRWFQFSLRTLFVLVTLAGFASPFIPQAVAWLFPTKDKDVASPTVNARFDIVDAHAPFTTPQDGDVAYDLEDDSRVWIFSRDKAVWTQSAPISKPRD